MKTIIPLLLAICIFQACVNESENDTSIISENELEKLRRFETPLRWNESVSTKNTFLFNGEITSEKNLFPKAFGSMFQDLEEKNATRQEVDRLISDKLRDFVNSDEISYEEKQYSRNIQYVVLKFFEEYLIQEDPSKEIADRATYYMDILVRHKVVDLSIMADVLVQNKRYMLKDKYNEFQEYLILAAEEKVDYVKNNWKEYYEIYQQSEGREKRRWQYEGNHLQGKLEEAKYVKNRLSSEF